MDRFKPGDRVVCIRADQAIDITLDFQYTVLKYDTHWNGVTLEVVCIKDDAGRESEYMADRFELVERLVEHPQLVAALVKPGEKIAAELTGSDANLLHMVIGISGEAGELLDAIKKAVIYRKELDRTNVIEELGDIEFYLEGLRQELGVSREECLAANVAKLQKRYGDKYSDSAAQIRADKEQS